MSELLLKDISLIDNVKNSGLVLFTWGEDNNDSEVIDRLKKQGVDAIIYDRLVNGPIFEMIQYKHLIPTLA